MIASGKTLATWVPLFVPFGDLLYFKSITVECQIIGPKSFEGWKTFENLIRGEIVISREIKE